MAARTKFLSSKDKTDIAPMARAAPSSGNGGAGQCQKNSGLDLLCFAAVIAFGRGSFLAGNSIVLQR